ncbi:hypothetical protein HU200_022846 [Digitaria exilis]|uniref:Uncharacterized protein n=1 Tax=Digitaria exilis TaxID=1010633 RepID=A0A835C0P5_9POAL|nr:hypothetical protein HU200_022846 [Digitaria exilis]
MSNEVKKQLCLAGPLVAGFLLQYAVQMVSIMFVGHLGELALAGAAVATSFAAATGFGLLFVVPVSARLWVLTADVHACQFGMVSSLDTLCGQAFGAGEHRQLGVHKQRAMLVLSLVSVPVAAVWACAGKVLARCGQDPEIAAAAGSYIRWLIPALFAFGPLQCHVRFLQAQNLVVPVMLSSGAAALGHPAVCWLLVRRLGFGFRGAALANGVSYLANLLFLALYVRLSPSCKTTWRGFCREALSGIPGFLKLAMPSALMMCFSISTFAFMVSSGLGVAISSDKEVIKYTRRMQPFVAASIMLDCQQSALSGVVRGCGWQKGGVFINLAAYYLVGIPAAVTFAFVCHLRGMALMAKDRVSSSTLLFLLRCQH